MKRSLKFLIAEGIAKREMICALALTCFGCAIQPFTADDVDYFQPPIVESNPPLRPLNSYSLHNNTTAVNLAKMLPIVPSFNGKGNLIASWNPHPDGVADRPTFVIVHGGHGLTPTNFANALWVRKELNANVLVLDSFWSRGRQENWLTYTRFGVNMRVLDVIAAGRWLQAKGIDKHRLFLMGDSQGGWTVLRLFTSEPFFMEHAKDLYRGGISLYPVCISKGTREEPLLGPYWGPVIVFTGGKDTGTPILQCRSDVFTKTMSWIHYSEATHAWDISNRGAHTPSVDGECGKALNTYNHFPVCRSDKRTEQMRVSIKQFLDRVGD